MKTLKRSSSGELRLRQVWGKMLRVKNNFHKNTTNCFSAALAPEVRIGTSEPASDHKQKIERRENLEKHEEMRAAKCAVQGAGCTGLISFIYLELIDASFSLDGVLGAFALSKDIIIISIGLAIGAMFVRSLTIMLVEKKTLKQFLYLEHGAHWAIGALACLMLVSTVKEIPEVVTGGIGLGFIVLAFISSIMHNKKMERLLADKGTENA